MESVNISVFRWLYVRKIALVLAFNLMINKSTVVSAMTLPCPEEDQRAIDLTLIFESSSLVTYEEFENVKTFLSKMVENLNIGSGETSGVRVSAINFSNKGQLVFDFQTNLERLTSNLTSIQQGTAETSANYLGIFYYNHLLETRSSMYRSEADKVALVLFYRSSNQLDKTEALTSTTQIEQDYGGHFIFIGITGSVNEQEMIELSSAPNIKNQNYFLIDRFESLVTPDVYQKVAWGICSREANKTEVANVTEDAFDVHAAETECLDVQFQCDDGSCIPTAYLCDGFPDCKQREDENNCATNQKNQTQTQTETETQAETETQTESQNGTVVEEVKAVEKRACVALEYTCDNGRCVYDGYVCDGEDDCRDNSDERNCDEVRSAATLNTTVTPVLRDCVKNEFECANGKCIYDGFRCDGDNDCGDLSDENNCFVEKSIECKEGEWLCASGDQCIKERNVCNLYQDCTDGSDEASKCKKAQVVKNEEEQLENKRTTASPTPAPTRTTSSPTTAVLKSSTPEEIEIDLKAFRLTEKEEQKMVEYGVGLGLPTGILAGILLTVLVAAVIYWLKKKNNSNKVESINDLSNDNSEKNNETSANSLSNGRSEKHEEASANNLSRARLEKYYEAGANNFSKVSPAEGDSKIMSQGNNNAGGQKSPLKRSEIYRVANKKSGVDPFLSARNARNLFFDTRSSPFIASNPSIDKKRYKKELADLKIPSNPFANSRDSSLEKKATSKSIFHDKMDDLLDKNSYRSKRSSSQTINKSSNNPVVYTKSASNISMDRQSDSITVKVKQSDSNPV